MAQPQDPANEPKRHAAGWVGHDRTHSASSRARGGGAGEAVESAPGAAQVGEVDHAELTPASTSSPVSQRNLHHPAGGPYRHVPPLEDD